MHLRITAAVFIAAFLMLSNVGCYTKLGYQQPVLQAGNIANESGNRQNTWYGKFNSYSRLKGYYITSWWHSRDWLNIESDGTYGGDSIDRSGSGYNNVPGGFQPDFTKAGRRIYKYQTGHGNSVVSDIIESRVPAIDSTSTGKKDKKFTRKGRK